MSKTFLITGGKLSNKGAQAMVFSVVQILRRIHPDCQIWMLYHSADNSDKRDIYNFFLLRWYLRSRLRIVLGKLSFLIKPRYKNNQKQVDELYKKADAVFDVSGYNLSSQFSFITSIIFINRIAHAKKFKTRLILLPQSFGPFNYKTIFQRWLTGILMKKYLKYPTNIFCREKQGYDDLKKFTSHNLSQALDIVLLSEKPERRLIYKTETESKVKTTVSANGIAIIPNSKILLWNKENDIWIIYREIIKGIIMQGKKVYILKHSEEDLEFCSRIAALTENDSSVNLLIEDYDCIELFEIISKMDLVIASRYHSLVHAYKSGVPALVIGWAEKYLELMAQFNQGKYCFDIRSKIEISSLLNVLKELSENKNHTSEIIKQRLNKHKKNSHELFKVFDRY